MTNQSCVKNIFSNIDLTRDFVQRNRHASIISVICGNRMDKQYWQQRFDQMKSVLFSADNSTRIISLEEKVGGKTKEGNFLGTLLAYSQIKQMARELEFSYQSHVILMGMLIGRGERVSPFSQIKGNRKPAITVTARNFQNNSRAPLTAIEEALHFFSPLTQCLRENGFLGILCKWGDETQIPSISFDKIFSHDLDQVDIIKFISILKITDELARQKDWVVFDSQGHMITQLARNKKDKLIEQLCELGIKPREDGEFYAGISLGPVAISYSFLEIANEIFSKEIREDGIFLDFDPYVLRVLAVDSDIDAWKQCVEEDENLQELEKLIPDFFQKIQDVKEMFKEKYQRNLTLKVADLGADISWMDIGQHTAMKQRYLSLNSKESIGDISRKIEGITSTRDEHGNIIVDSFISPDVREKHNIEQIKTGP